MNRRPVLLSSAAAATLLLCASGATAGAATPASPAAGKGTTSLTLLDLAAGGHTLQVGDLGLVSDTTGGSPVASVAVTPLVADGTAYGKQTVTPASSPVSVPSVTSPSALGSVFSVTTPAFSTTASSAPSTHAGASSFGSASLLGTALPLSGSLDLGSAVSATTGALGQKTFTIDNLALPSIADLLGKVGIDVSALPVGTLDTLVSQLGLVTSAVTTAQGAVDTVQAQVDAATADLTAKTASLTAAQGTLATATTALTAATATLQADLDQIATLAPAVLASDPTANTIAGYAALVTAGSPLVAAIDAVIPSTSGDYTAYLSAQSAVTTATAAVAAAQALVDTAQALLNTLTSQLTAAIDTLVGALVAVLNGTPLVSLDSLSVTTKAAASSATTGGQTAEVVGGTVTGLKVLGTDVLQTALGSSSVNVVDLAGTALGKVTTTLNGLTGTLSSVLSNVVELPALSVPAPQVQLLTKTVSTSISGGFGRATTSVTGLRITIPAITLPTSVALPGAASLPALGGVTQTAGQLTSAPITIGLGTLADSAAFRPAVAGTTTPTGGTPTGGTPTGQRPTLASTGLPAGVAVLSLVLVGGALVLRRRVQSEG